VIVRRAGGTFPQVSSSCKIPPCPPRSARSPFCSGAQIIKCRLRAPLSDFPFDAGWMYLESHSTISSALAAIPLRWGSCGRARRGSLTPPFNTGACRTKSAAQPLSCLELRANQAATHFVALIKSDALHSEGPRRNTGPTLF